jgi:hypothetical protein
VDFAKVALLPRVFAKGEAGGGKPKNKEEIKNGKRNFNETAFGSRCSFRTPDKKMEP